jgi:sensor histidine kinase YesM
MKMKIGSLSLIFVLFYLVYEPLQVLLDTGSVGEAFYGFQGVQEMGLFLSTLLYLWLYTAGAYWMFYKVYTKERQWLSFSLLIVVALFAIMVRYLLQEVLGRLLFGVGNYTDSTTLSYYIFDNLYYAIIYISLGTVYFFVQYAQYKEVQQRELLLQTQKTELTLLRSQLNPHFLFNILNNIYSLIYYQSENALKSVEKLSGLLRYVLYEKSEKVTVKKEVAYLNDFIDLHRMRLDYEPALDLQIAPATLSLQIAPFLLIPFVENAFKHGELENQEKPMVISLAKSEQELEFTVRNEKKKRQKDEVGGIGIRNVEKRLQLLYGDQAKLEVQESETNFYVNLKIALAVC